MFAIVICLVLLMCTFNHLRFCVVCINGRRYVCCGECYVVSNVCDELTSCPVQPIAVVKLWTLGYLGFLNCDDVCMCVVNKQFFSESHQSS